MPNPRDFPSPALLTDKKRVAIYLATLLGTYYDHLIGQAGASFANLIQTGKRMKMD